VAQGDVIAVRYADDAVLGFQYREEAERFLADLRERLGKFGLELHPEKTRLIEFGRYAAERRAKRGEGKPETFNFLGFTHICGKNHVTGHFHGVSENDRQADGSQAEGYKAEAAQSAARVHRQHGEMATGSGSWILPISRGTAQRATNEGVSS
jgi:hypothetical protein